MFSALQRLLGRSGGAPGAARLFGGVSVRRGGFAKVEKIELFAGFAFTAHKRGFSDDRGLDMIDKSLPRLSGYFICVYTT